MYRAVTARDSSFDGVFFTAVKTTGIFCRPGCPARTPNRANVEFFPTVSTALHAGYRPCLRCRPLDPAGSAPPWVSRVLAWVERSPSRRLTSAQLRSRGVDPARASRYFKSRFGMTFQGYQRARRMGLALHEVRAAATKHTQGQRKSGMLTETANRAGFTSDSGFREAFTKMFGAAPSRAAASGNANTLTARWIETPLGPMLAAASDEGLCLLEFVDRRALATQITVLRRRFNSVVVPGDNPHLDSIADELSRYFAGQLAEFRTPLVLRGTDFQAQVWDALQRIPAAVTRSYADIAREIGRSTAVRAVARANGDNRLAIVIPCHRVIGSDGSATGYGGGIWRKLWLLDHERAMAAKLGLKPANGAKSSTAGLFDDAPRRK